MRSIKTHFRNHKEFYISFGVGLTVAGITSPIMRNVINQHISRDVIVAANRDIAVVVDRSVVINSISYISFPKRQGPPSYIVKCLETGAIFNSQRSAALSMNLSAVELSNHLNGARDHVRGYTFERIGMAF